MENATVTTTMRRNAAMMGLAPALAGLMLLGGCATYGYGGYWSSGYPAYSGYGYGYDYDYRYRNPDGLIVAYDPGPSLYAVVSYQNLYWNDGYYYRRHGSHWERSRHHRGPWAVHRHEPPRVSVRNEPRPGRQIPPGAVVPDRRSVRGPVIRSPQGEPFQRPPSGRDGGLNVRGPRQHVRYGERLPDPQTRWVERARVPNGVPLSTGPNREVQRPRLSGPPQSWNGARPFGVNPPPGTGRGSRPAVVNQAPDQPRQGPGAPRFERTEQARNSRRGPGGPPVDPRSYPAQGERPAPARRRPVVPTTDEVSNREQATSDRDARRAAPGWRPRGPRSGDQGLGAAPNRDANRWHGQPRGEQPGTGRRVSF